MPEKLVHRLESLLAGRATGNDNSLSALGDCRRFVDVGAEVVAQDFLLNGSEQTGLLHGGLRSVRIGRGTAIVRDGMPGEHNTKPCLRKKATHGGLDTSNRPQAGRRGPCGTLNVGV